MKKIILYFTILLVFSSCDKDSLTWELKRLSSKDARLEVSDLIYSNNCSAMTGFQLIATGPGSPSSIYWGISNNGFSGDCFMTQGSSTNATIIFNLNITKGGILRFYFKNGSIYEINSQPSLKINTIPINTAIISGNQDSKGEWLQMQTELLKPGNNTVEIKFSVGTIKTFYIDEIELWTPRY